MPKPAGAIRALVAIAALMLAACGDDVGAGGGTSGRPTVVVTTNILGDVVENLVDGHLHVETVMPLGADPHDFQASAQQVAGIGDADAVIVNGADFEEGLVDVIESAEDDGVPVFAAISAVATIGDRERPDGGVDPHFFTDPARMAVAASAIVDFVIDAVDGVDTEALRSNADAYIAELEALDAEVERMLEGLSEDQRVLVTNHEVFGYFADRYGFEVVGTVIPGGTTVDAASAQALAELSDVVADEGVPAIFADTSSSDELAQTLADEVGGVEVVELFSESLGDEDSDGPTYLEMVRANAARIAAALGA